MFLFQMQFMVYFYKDREIIIISEDDLISEIYHNYTMDDWEKTGNKECRVKVLYNDEIFDACVLQVSESFFGV